MPYSSVEHVINLSGAVPNKLGLKDTEGGATAQQKLEALIALWLEEISSAIDARLPASPIADTDPRRKSVDLIAKTRTADLYQLAVMHRGTPIIRIDEFATKIVTISSVLKDLDKDLQNFISQPALKEAVFEAM